MDLSIPEELDLLRQTVRDFVERELRPLEAEVEELDEVSKETLSRLRKKARAIGLYGFNLPERVGGGGLGPIGEALIGQEVGRTTMALGETIGRLPPILELTRDDQVDWLLQPILSGDAQICNALTEPDAGSDLRALKTTATRKGDGWVLSGSKQFISHADTSDFIVVLAVTDPNAPLHGRFSTFVVERSNPGVVSLGRHRMMGWRGYSVASFSLDQCEIREDQILGEIGKGFANIMSAVNRTRLYLSSKCVGSAGELIRLSRDHARTRETFGRRLGDHQFIQFALADMDLDHEASKLLVMAAAWQGESDLPDFRIAAARAKLHTSEMLGRVADAAVQIFGGAGYMCDLPIERMYRDARAFRIGEGTTEMQRIQIGKHVLEGMR